MSQYSSGEHINNMLAGAFRISASQEKVDMKLSEEVFMYCIWSY